jgi:hypothetical protein
MSWTPTLGEVTNMYSVCQRNAEELFRTFREPLYQKRVRFRPLRGWSQQDYIGDIPELLEFPVSLVQNFVLSFFLSGNDYGVGFPYQAWAKDVNESYFTLLHTTLSEILKLRRQRGSDENLRINLNTFLTEHLQRDHLQERINEMERAPNLGSIELSSTREAPFENIFIEERDRDLVATSMTWLKMRFFQLKCAMLFNNEFTEYVGKIMTRFHSRRDPMNAAGGIIQMQFQILLLFANGRFDRAHQLVRQTAEALNVFLLEDSIQIPPYKELISTTKKALVVQTMGGSERLSNHKNLFPLNEWTRLDDLLNMSYIHLPQGYTFYPNSGGKEFRMKIFVTLSESLLRYVRIIQDRRSREIFLKIFNEIIEGVHKKEFQRRSGGRNGNIAMTIFNRERNFQRNISDDIYQ